jgi:hypothetical protein
MNASATHANAPITACRYAGFALVAIISNISAQQLVMGITPVAPLAFSIAVGTLVGFATKYILDKKYIFFDEYSGHARETIKLLLYGSSSLLTTVVFWSFEASCWLVWHSDLAKYSGATVGLTVGYASKFFLDKYFTFHPVQRRCN